MSLVLFQWYREGKFAWKNQWRNTIPVWYVANHLTLGIIFEMYITSQTDFYFRVFFTCICGLILEKNHTNAMNMKMHFLNNIHLIGHFKIHTGEKPCQCNQCAKAFSMKCDLKWHLKIHSGDKLCKCSYYDKVFYSKNSDLTEHLKTHSGEKVYQCSHCDKTFYKVLIL